MWFHLRGMSLVRHEIARAEFRPIFQAAVFTWLTVGVGLNLALSKEEIEASNYTKRMNGTYQPSH